MYICIEQNKKNFLCKKDLKQYIMICIGHRYLLSCRNIEEMKVMPRFCMYKKALIPTFEIDFYNYAINFLSFLQAHTNSTAGFKYF